MLYVLLLVLDVSLNNNLIVCNLDRDKLAIDNVNYNEFIGDISDESFIENTINKISNLGNIKILINNAGEPSFKLPTKYEKEDKDFKTAIIRETNEEMGSSVNIKINDSTGIAYFNLNNTSHIFIIYYGKYIDGKIEIMEPDKCMNYKFFTYEEAINSNMVTKECKFLINNIKKYQSAID